MSDKETSAAPVAAPEPAAASPVPVVEEGKKDASPAPAAPAAAEAQPEAEATEEAAAPATTEEDKPKSESEPKTNGNGNGESANGNGNGDGDAPVSVSAAAPVAAPSAPSSDKQTRTSSRTKQESSSKPAPAPKAPKAPKQARSSSAATAGASKKVSGGDKNFSIGDIVLARLKGFPAWPARIADPDTLAKKVLAARPGKSANTFCVQYFPVGDYSWLSAKDLDPLSASDISTYLSAGHRAKGELKVAYQTAQDPTEWDEAQSELAQKAEAGEGEMEIDELDEEEGDDVDAPGAGGKRKKANGVKEGSKKKVKTEKKKDDSATKSKKIAAKPKAGKKVAESKPVVENQASGDDAPNQECAKVKDWRHKLQRAFLSKSVPDSDEMQTYDDLFKSIERYDGMTIEALQYSKIGKVMKKIAAMEKEIPRNDEFKITERAQKLMEEWQAYIEKSGDGKKGANGGMEA